ncbi:MAG: hypothetical protein IJV99_04150 [Clostridia bacterium]|nr:hypothetical protein [Clostridia bacterium]
MKFSVGYGTRADERFLNEIIRLKDNISEVYFSWGKTPSGRNDQTRSAGLTPWEAMNKQIEDLTFLHKAGLKFNLLFNANCYGDKAQSRELFNSVGETVDYVASNFSLSSVTTTSLLIAKFIKQNFEGIDVRASVNMGIGSVLGLKYVSEYFDSFYVKRELNRDFNALKSLKKWCSDNGKEMYILANSGCLNDCSAHTFHDNLVAHEEGASAMDNGYQFSGVCKEFLSNPDNMQGLLTATNYIRPEDTCLYDGLVPAMKLATRVHENPVRVLRAYVENCKFVGNTAGLLEPNHSHAIYPFVLENDRIKRQVKDGKLIYSGEDAFAKLDQDVPFFENENIDLNK